MANGYGKREFRLRRRFGNWIDRNDIKVVTDVLESDWITQGPKIAEFERCLASYCRAKYALYPYYKQRLNYKEGDYPKAEGYYKRAITLPLFPKMRRKDIAYVIREVKNIIRTCSKKNQK